MVSAAASPLASLQEYALLQVAPPTPVAPTPVSQQKDTASSSTPTITAAATATAATKIKTMATKTAGSFGILLLSLIVVLVIALVTMTQLYLSEQFQHQLDVYEMKQQLINSQALQNDERSRSAIYTDTLQAEIKYWQEQANTYKAGLDAYQDLLVLPETED